MKRFSRVLVSLSGLAGFALLVALLPAQKAAATGSAPVTVTNTPLPISGTVGATVSGNVNANITNATVPVSGTVAVSSLPSVNLGGNVTVGNTSSNPVMTLNLETSSRIPYRSTAQFSCGPAGCDAVFLTAPPAGFRLVITEVSAQLAPTIDSSGAFVYLAGGAGALFVPGTVTQNGKTIINQQVNYILDSTDSAPSINSPDVFVTPGVGQVTLTGYMINCSTVSCPAVQN